jgi:hypothetical protein
MVLYTKNNLIGEYNRGCDEIEINFILFCIYYKGTINFITKHKHEHEHKYFY